MFDQINQKLSDGNFVQHTLDNSSRIQEEKHMKEEIQRKKQDAERK
jgi:hypothetical protein